MGDNGRWRELDSVMGRLTDDPATEWIDVRDLFFGTAVNDRIPEGNKAAGHVPAPHGRMKTGR